jgi:hypothetical protein
MIAHFPKVAQGRHLHHQQTRSIFNKNIPPPLVNDIVPSSPPLRHRLSTIERYTPRDPMSRLMLTSVLAMFTLVLVFMLLNHTRIRAMLILVSKIIMIYILILIGKLSNYSTIITLYCLAVEREMHARFCIYI